MYNFAILDIGYSRLPYGVQILVTTDAPCHLTCYWTDKKPLKHHTSRVVRGLKVPWGVYFCFVAWHAVEQNEAGDTLSHTFDLTPWEWCNFRWFTFRGTVGAEISPSAGPIFEKHNSFQWLTKYEFYSAAYDTNSYTSATVKLAQTFTPQKDHLITEVVLLLLRYGAPTIMNVAIEGTTPAEKPNDIILASGTFDTGDLLTGPTWNAIWLPIPVTPFQLDKWFKYSIVIWGGTDAKRAGWNAKTANPYLRGQAWYWRPGIWGWWPTMNWDYLFEEWGYPL